MLLLLAITLVGGAVPFVLYGGTEALWNGLLFGVLSLALPSITLDLLTILVLRRDPLLTTRRSTALSVIISVLSVLLLTISALVARFTGNVVWMAKAFMMSLWLSVSLRFLVFTGLSSSNTLRTTLLSLIQPLQSLIGAYAVLPMSPNVVCAGIVGSMSSLFGAWLVVKAVQGSGLDSPSSDPLGLFRAFLMAWAGGISGPLETYLEARGENADLYVDELVFDASKGCEGALVISHIHSGPFRNTGSSELPAMMNRELERKLGGEVLLLHGISTHERDLASRKQSEKVVEAVLEVAGSGTKAVEASTMIRRKAGCASSTCQIFGRVGLVTLTISPKSFDDLPHSLEERIREAGSSIGLEPIVVDLHNSIDRDFKLANEDYTDLYEAAVEAMKEAAASPKGAFKVGISSIAPSEFTPKDGMGPAGFGAFVVEVAGQTSAVAVVDGNNMISGLREELVSTLKQAGFEEAEVATSDTHIVNGLSISPRGYYPIGERVDPTSTRDYVRKAADQARRKLEPASVKHVRVKVEGIKIIGERGLQFLGDILEASFKHFKRGVVIRLLPALGLSLLLLLLV